MKHVFSILAVVLAIGVLMYTVTFAEDAPKPPAYVGDDLNKCKTCHADKVKIMASSKMFTAYSSLPDDSKTKPECYKCHVTGYDKEGGFVDAEKTPLLLNVQCEACHGPAGDHIKNPMKVKPSNDPKTACAGCHNKEYPGFKADEWKIDDALASIKHWKDAPAAG